MPSRLAWLAAARLSFSTIFQRFSVTRCPVLRPNCNESENYTDAQSYKLWTNDDNDDVDDQHRQRQWHWNEESSSRLAVSCVSTVHSFSWPLVSISVFWMSPRCGFDVISLFDDERSKEMKLNICVWWLCNEYVIGLREWLNMISVQCNRARFITIVGIRYCTTQIRTTHNARSNMGHFRSVWKSTAVIVRVINVNILSLGQLLFRFNSFFLVCGVCLCVFLCEVLLI